MARNRMLNPEFWLDEELAQISPHARLLYMGLWAICDDNYATLPNRPDWIKAQVFPYESVSIPQLLGELSELGKIIEFQHGGKSFWWIKNFSKYQRVEKPSKSKYPPYDSDSRGGVGEESGRSPQLVGAEVKRREVKRREVKLSEEKSVAKATELTPKTIPTNSKKPMDEFEIDPDIANDTSVIPKKPFGNPLVNGAIEAITEHLSGKPDGTIKENRQYANLLINALKKEYPDQDPIELIRQLLKASLADQFLARNCTSLRWLYYNKQKIIQTLKTYKSNVVKIS